MTITLDEVIEEEGDSSLVSHTSPLGRFSFEGNVRMNKLKIAKLALGPLKFIWKNKLLRNLVGAAVAKIIKGVARKKVGAVKANVGAKMVGAKAKVAAGA